MEMESVHPHATGEAELTAKAHEQQSEFVLYGSWFCPFTQRVWIALEERGLPYQYVEINPFQKNPAFLAMNPKGLVPTIQYNGQPLYESMIICEFLEELYPDNQSKLLPADPYARAQVRVWVDYIGKFVVPSYFRLFQARTPETQQAAVDDFSAALRVFADKAQGPYFMGEEFGLADIAILSWITRDYILEQHRGFSREGVSSKFKAYAENLEKRPSAVRTTSLRHHYDRIWAKHLDDTLDSAVVRATKAGRPLP